MYSDPGNRSERFSQELAKSLSMGYNERVGCMSRRFKSSSDIVIDMFPKKENVAKVLRSFKVVADDFPKYVMVGAGMSTS